jgi:ribosomal protein L6P/L9E
MRDTRKWQFFSSSKKFHLYMSITANGYYVSVRGPLGTITRFYSDKITTICDQPLITSYLFSSNSVFRAIWPDIRKIIGGVCVGYSLRVALHGIIYACWRPARKKLSNDKKGKFRSPYIHMRLGFRHLIVLKLPPISKLWLKRRDIRIFSMEFNKLRNFGIRMRRLAWPNTYTSTGIQYRGEIVKTKPGKQRLWLNHFYLINALISIINLIQYLGQFLVLVIKNQVICMRNMALQWPHT